MKYTLPTSKDKPKYIQEKFEGIAKKYDLFNDIITFGMHRKWKSFVAQKTDLHGKQNCLDLCCGTGDIAREVFRQYPSSEVTGLDFILINILSYVAGVATGLIVCCKNKDKLLVKSME